MSSEPRNDMERVFGRPVARPTVNLDALEAIRRNDPDGREQQPTEADYQEFREWVLKYYGAPSMARLSRHMGRMI